LYQYLVPDDARRLARCFEWIYAPKHASWLNIAEMEWSVLERQCLRQRLPTQTAVEKELLAWETERNTAAIKVEWQFGTVAARLKLKRHYPELG
jgi:DDE superfamily endonuclease